MNPHPAAWLTGGIFAATYAGLAVGRIPGLRVDRPAIAYCGAALVLCTGGLSLAEATSGDAIDYQTLLLLLGMMVVVGFLRFSGAFARVTGATLSRVKSPRGLLAAVVVLGGRAVGVPGQRRRLPGPDAGRAAPGPAAGVRPGAAPDRPGDGGERRLGRHRHRQPAEHDHRLGQRQRVRALRRAPAAGRPGRAGGGLRRRRGRVPRRAAARRCRPRDGPAGGDAPCRRVHRRLQAQGVVVTLATVLLFFTGLPIALVATAAAAVLLLLGRVRPRRAYDEIDWTLLLMFVGLFVVVHAFQVHVVSAWHVEQWQWLLRRPVGLLSVASAALSNLVSNVPAVLLLEPLVHAMPDASRTTAWLALAMSSTFAGNLTVLGSVANLIVVEGARREGVHVSFGEYCRAGVPVTLLTLGLGVGWLLVVG